MRAGARGKHGKSTNSKDLQKMSEIASDNEEEFAGIKFSVDSNVLQHSATIVNFTNGRLDPKRAEDVRFSKFVASDADRHRIQKKIMVAETEQMQYVGHNTGPGAPKAPNYCKYYLGVRCRKTGKMKMYNTEMFNLWPRNEDEEIEEKEEEKELTFIQKTDNLTTAFGSSRKRKALDARIKNKISDATLDAVVGTAVRQTLSNPETRKSLGKASMPKQDHTADIPPFNKDAETPQEVYLLHDIISDAEIEALKTMAQELADSTRDKQREWLKSERFSTYICHELSIMPIQEEARLKRSCCLYYLHYMIYLFSLKAHDLRKKAFMPSDTPNIVKTVLLDRFTLVMPGLGGKPSRCIPARQKDKLLSYILVLCLIIDDFNLDCSALQCDLKNAKKLPNHLRALGCKVQTRKVNRVEQPATATLPVPLTFPEISTRNKKKSKR